MYTKNLDMDPLVRTENKVTYLLQISADGVLFFFWVMICIVCSAFPAEPCLSGFSLPVNVSGSPCFCVIDLSCLDFVEHSLSSIQYKLQTQLLCYCLNSVC